MTPLDFLLLVLATWRLSHLFASEDGPYDMFLRLRTRYPLGGLLTCAYCLSVWIAFMLVFLLSPMEWSIAYRVVLAFAVSGGALGFGTWSGANIR